MLRIDGERCVHARAAAASCQRCVQICPQAAWRLADDGLAFSALAFLVCTYVIFLALRAHRNGRARRLEQLADVLFLLALTLMVASGFMFVYTVL